MVLIRTLATGFAVLLVFAGAADARGHPTKAARAYDGGAPRTSIHGRYQSSYVATHRTVHTVTVRPRYRHRPRK